ncbi:MAG: ribbon-helix-helix domain-containing protein [Thermoprotei archaeon]
MSDYVGVRLPKELIDLVDEIVKSRKYGYRSRAEFIAEAVREKLAKMGLIKV